MSKGKEIVDKLVDRKGFDDWWYGIDNEVQEEIVAEIDAIIEQPKPEHEKWRDLALKYDAERMELRGRAQAAEAALAGQPKLEPVAWCIRSFGQLFYHEGDTDKSVVERNLSRNWSGPHYDAELVPFYTAPPAIPSGYALTYKQQYEIGQRFGVTSVVVEQILEAAAKVQQP